MELLSPVGGQTYTRRGFGQFPQRSEPPEERTIPGGTPKDRDIEQFRRISLGRRKDAPGDVTHGEGMIGDRYADLYPFPKVGEKREMPEVAVENSNFSTISTSFSTGVFHRDHPIVSLHNILRQDPTVCPLFRMCDLCQMGGGRVRKIGLDKPVLGRACGRRSPGRRGHHDHGSVYPVSSRKTCTQDLSAAATQRYHRGPYETFISHAGPGDRPQIPRWFWLMGVDFSGGSLYNTVSDRITLRCSIRGPFIGPPEDRR